MKYTEEQRTGDVGEHLVAVCFIRLFGWVCRLQDRDTGIDAEYETTEVGEVLSGQVVKLQIKATDANFKVGDNSFYVKEDHINYWKNFSVPVVFCFVSLQTNEVMWACIESESDYRTERSGYKLTLRYPENVLKTGDEAELRDIAHRTKDPLFQLVLHAESDMKRVWSGNKLLLDHRRNEDEDFFSALGELLRRIDSLMRTSAGASRHKLLKGRVDSLWSKYNAANRNLDRRADADLDARDG